MVLGATHLFWNWDCSDPAGLPGAVALNEVNTKFFSLLGSWGG
jgi:hypothetical protein